MFLGKHILILDSKLSAQAKDKYMYSSIHFLQNEFDKYGTMCLISGIFRREPTISEAWRLNFLNEASHILSNPLYSGPPQPGVKSIIPFMYTLVFPIP